MLLIRYVVMKMLQEIFIGKGKTDIWGKRKSGDKFDISGHITNHFTWKKFYYICLFHYGYVMEGSNAILKIIWI